MVKVNARVDVEIAELVAALNRYPNLQTLQSCEGEPGGEAYVFFTCGSWQSTCEFLFGKIAPALSAKIDDETLRIEVFVNADRVGRIDFKPETIGDIMFEILRLEQM